MTETKRMDRGGMEEEKRREDGRERVRWRKKQTEKGWEEKEQKNRKRKQNNRETKKDPRKIS